MFRPKEGPGVPARRAGRCPRGPGDPRGWGGITMNDLTGGELPSPRADPVIIREEDFGFVLRGKIPASRRSWT